MHNHTDSHVALPGTRYIYIYIYRHTHTYIYCIMIFIYNLSQIYTNPTEVNNLKIVKVRIHKYS